MKDKFVKHFASLQNQKTCFRNVFYCYKEETFFSKRFAYLQNGKRTRFWSMLHLCKMTNTFWNRFTFRAMKKNTFTNRFACLGKKQILHLWSAFDFVRMENMFSKRFACLQNRKNTFVKRFYLHRVETWFGNIFPLSKITKTRFWSIFHV